jgi:hypothetical protein
VEVAEVVEEAMPVPTKYCDILGVNEWQEGQ